MSADRPEPTLLGYRSFEHQDQVHQEFVGKLPPLDGLSIIDVGCGYGKLHCWLPTTIKSYVGFDKNIDYVQKSHTLRPHLDIREGTIDGEADVVMCVAVLHDMAEHHRESFIHRLWEHTRYCLAIAVWKGDGNTHTYVANWVRELPQVSRVVQNSKPGGAENFQHIYVYREQNV